jgi:diguanylate cyclase (GGDEF)-like protein
LARSSKDARDEEAAGRARPRTPVQAAAQAVVLAAFLGIGAAFAAESIARASSAVPGCVGAAADVLVGIGLTLATGLFWTASGRKPGHAAAIGLAAAIPCGAALWLRGYEPGAGAMPLGFGLLAALTTAASLAPPRRAERIRLARAAAIDATGDGVLVVDAEGRVLEANEAARLALDLEPRGGSRTARGVTPGAASVLPAEGFERLLAQPELGHITFQTESGRFFEAWVTPADANASLKGTRAVVVRDVTGRRRDERRLFRLAHYDSLTGLANRRLFVEQLERSLERAREENHLVALLYVDLDHFKDINDALGHGAGDELLCTLAQRFRNHLRADDLLALGSSSERPADVSRLAGDEFAVVVPRIAEGMAAGNVAERILELIAEPVELMGRSVTNTGSIGISVFPRDGDEIETLVKHADAALYAAKRLGRGRFEFYDASLSEPNDRARVIEQELALALERGELRLQYQPKVDLATGTVSGFEALLRWNCATLGPIPPKDFIPVAEARGLVSAIGSWCIAEACRQLRSWREAGFEPVPVSVNVSAHQFAQTDLERVVTEALRESGIEPRLLELELTESLLLDDNDASSLCLRNLRAIGVRVALDDFGTGYSALTYLNRFPLDVLKMDRGLLRDVENSDSVAGIASAVVAMAHALGLEVVAEGVDVEEQIERLRGMGCDLVQGFVYAPALPPGDATRFLARDGGARPEVRPSEKTSPGWLSAHAVATPPRRPDERRRDGAATRRVLVVDDPHGALASVALRLTRLGADVRYAVDVEEGRQQVALDQAKIRLVIAPPTIDPQGIAILREDLAAHLRDAKPALLFVGDEPDERTRGYLRDAGATWVLWAPFDDAELRFVVTAAMAFPDELVVRKEPRVPADLTAWLRCGNHREVGVISNLSPIGAFIEVANLPPVGSGVRIEFQVGEARVRTFATVSHVQSGSHDDDHAAWKPRGMGIAFAKLEPDVALALRTLVEERAARYVP